MTTLFVEQLTVIDFSYFDPDRGIVGESWILDVELDGSLDDNGMVFDFTHVKKQIKQYVDQLIDHKFVVANHYKNLKTQLESDQLTLELHTNNKDYYCHKSPVQAVTFVPAETISIETVLPFLQDSIKSILPANVHDLRIRLKEESIEGAFYHYSHGLKKHFGDCQRIAHGHRSKIIVHRNNKRDESLEQKIAEEWRDIYLITEGDITSRQNLNEKPYVTLGYSANQGSFELTLPENVCDTLETDSTVELIAEHLAQKLKQENPTDTFSVRAFEGVKKGAIAKA